MSESFDLKSHVPTSDEAFFQESGTSSPRKIRQLIPQPTEDPQDPLVSKA